MRMFNSARIRCLQHHLDCLSKIITFSFLVNHRLSSYIEIMPSEKKRKKKRSKNDCMTFTWKNYVDLINLSCGNVVFSSKCHIQEALIVSEIQVNLIEGNGRVQAIIRLQIITSIESCYHSKKSLPYPINLRLVIIRIQIERINYR